MIIARWFAEFCSFSAFSLFLICVLWRDVNSSQRKSQSPTNCMIVKILVRLHANYCTINLWLQERARKVLSYCMKFFCRPTIVSSIYERDEFIDNIVKLLIIVRFYGINLLDIRFVRIFMLMREILPYALHRIILSQVFNQMIIWEGICMHKNSACTKIAYMFQKISLWCASTLRMCWGSPAFAKDFACTRRYSSTRKELVCAIWESRISSFCVQKVIW